MENKTLDSAKNDLKRRRILSGKATGQSTEMMGDDNDKKLALLKSLSKPRTAFFSLPTEIRNIIY